MSYKEQQSCDQQLHLLSKELAAVECSRRRTALAKYHKVAVVSSVFLCGAASLMRDGEAEEAERALF